MKKAAQNKFILILAISVLVGIFLLTSIFKKPQKKVEDTNQSSGYEYEYQERKLVGDFPDIPQHPEANILSSSSRAEGDSIEYSATLQIDNSDPQEVAGWFDSALKQEGYQFPDYYDLSADEEGVYEMRVTKDEISYRFKIYDSADSGTEVIIDAEIDHD